MDVFGMRGLCDKEIMTIFISLVICIGSIIPTTKKTVPEVCGFPSSPMQITSTQAEGTRVFMKELIINSPKYGKKIVFYDDEDHDLISKYHWWVIISKKFKNKKRILGDRFYCCTAITVSLNKRRMIQMHQLILGFPKGDIDHRNGNGLDNQKLNLRKCTSSQNARNRANRSDNTSGYKGVTWHIHVKKWGSNIWVDGKRIHLGYFEKAIDGGIAYNNAAKKYFGEFARLNPIPA